MAKNSTKPIDPNQKIEKIGKENCTDYFLKWSLCKKTLEKQINEYDNLSLFHSRRGIATITAGLIVASSLAYQSSIFSESYSSLNDLKILAICWLITVIIFAPIIFFIARGHMWAMILFVLIFTINQLNILAMGNWLSLFIWLIIIPIFTKALIVEGTRRKRENNSLQ